jgi:hypothetical protein
VDGVKERKERKEKERKARKGKNNDVKWDAREHPTES